MVVVSAKPLFAVLWKIAPPAPLDEFAEKAVPPVKSMPVLVYTPPPSELEVFEPMLPPPIVDCGVALEPL